MIPALLRPAAFCFLVTTGVFAALQPHPATAQDVEDGEVTKKAKDDDNQPRLRVEGQKLIYDTENVSDDEPNEIVVDDIEAFRELLKDHAGVDELQINSSGGSIYASGEIAWIVRDYGLNTIVVGECTSACVDVFLAGSRRRMTLGSKIGFHRRSWSPDSVEGYYEDQQDHFEWESPFEYGSWIYEDTQREMHVHLATMLDRGVDPEFAIETLRPPVSDVWYPSRIRLMAAGVLREEAP